MGCMAYGFGTDDDTATKFGTVAFYASLGRAFVTMCAVIPVLFLIEVIDRTEADKKGGHIATRREGGGLVLREIAQAVGDARDADRRATMVALQELHRLIERGTITEAEFDEREAVLLDKMDELGPGS